MPLARSIKLISVSADGKIITIQETTGNYDASTNPGGYGTPNPDITDFQSMLIVGLFINGTTINMVLTDYGTLQLYLAGDPNTLGLNSLMSPGVNGVYPFIDGVLKLSSYAQLASATVSGVSGNAYITGTGLTPFITAEYVITPEYAIYQIDSGNAGNTDSQIFLKTSITTDFIAATPAFYAACYAMVNAEFICKLTNAIAAMAAHGGDEDDRAAYLTDILVKKFAADFEFANKDYIAADFSIRSGITKLNRLHHG